MFFTKKQENQKGVILYLTITLLSFMTSVLMVLVSLAISQTRDVLTASDSVAAFYAADTGVERTLYKIYKEGWVPPDVNVCFFPWQDVSADFSDIEYQVCTSANASTTIWASGNFKKSNTQRKIEIDVTP